MFIFKLEYIWLVESRSVDIIFSVNYIIMIAT